MELSDPTIARRPRRPIGSARLTVLGRRQLVVRFVQDRRPLSHISRELGVSRRCAPRWGLRTRAGSGVRLSDLSSWPRSAPRRSRPEREWNVLEARGRLRAGPARHAAVTQVLFRPISMILRRH
ncbi:hypothetical protein ITJ40_01325 [Clavibacter sp. VKM Ac-2872]|nr:hypothetical protein [Clavibacter sp. VKM Ac-2872]